MAETIKELRSMDDDELIRRHDAKSGSVEVATGHYLAELARRDTERANRTVVELTGTMTKLTWVIAALTLINALAAVAQVVG